MIKLRKTIYISGDYERVQQVAKEKGKNFSKYICDLIEKDLDAHEDISHRQYDSLMNELQDLKTLLASGNLVVNQAPAPVVAPIKDFATKQKEEQKKKKRKNVMSF